MTNKRILLYLGHPAHYHNLKNVARELVERGCEVRFVAREKDVLARLLEKEAISTVLLPGRKSRSRIGMAINILQREWRMWKIVRRFRPDILVGTDIVIAHIGRLSGIPSVLLNEDDLDEIPLFAKYGVRFCSAHLAPMGCRVKGYEQRTLTYPSYHELAYLHPEHFIPDAGLIAPYIDTERPFFIVRFAQLTAHHDKGKTGITAPVARRLIELLEQRGSVYITSERPLEEEFEKYRIAVPPDLIHHALAFAELYVGDSQTMAAEAAVLGTPSLRFNDFVGRLSYLDELEHRYHLTRGIATSNPDLFLDAVSEIIGQADKHSDFTRNRLKMLEEKVNLVPLWTDFILHFPHRTIKGFSRP